MIQLLLLRYWFIWVTLLFIAVWFSYKKRYIAKRSLLYLLLVILGVVVVVMVFTFNHVIHQPDMYKLDPDTHRVVPR